MSQMNEIRAALLAERIEDAQQQLARLVQEQYRMEDARKKRVEAIELDTPSPVASKESVTYEDLSKKSGGSVQRTNENREQTR